MATVTEARNHLTGMLHSGSALGKVRNFYHALDRASKNLLANIKPVDSERIAALSSLIYDDLYNYTLPSDFGWPIELRPQGIRDNNEAAARRFAAPFDLLKEIHEKRISIEGNEGTKFIRINWRRKSPLVIDGMNEVGDWAVVATATGLKAQKLHKISGNASLEFDLAATGDGISNTALTSLDLTEEDEIVDVFVWVYLPTTADVANLTSATVRWGNDVSTAYWESAAETDQADGTAFKVGWNLLKFAWSDATETGTVDPSAIDSFRIVFTIAGAISNIKVDAPVYVLGSPFDIKYYSKFGFKNSAGTYMERPTADGDTIVYSETAFLIFLWEAVKACAHQIEGEDSVFDLREARTNLHGDPGSPDPIQRMGLYAKYRSEYPSQTQRAVRLWARTRNPNYHRR